MTITSPALIGIGGNGYECGKDSVADNLVAHRGFQKVFMSEPLERIIYIMNPWIKINKPVVNPYVEAEGQPKEQFVFWVGQVIKYRQLLEYTDYTGAKRQQDVREFLQLMGTEVGRKIIGENVWVSIADKAIWKVREGGTPVVITGMRYANELAAIKHHGGVLVWVERPGIEVNEHDSETSVKKEDFDIVVMNDGSLDDLEYRSLTMADTLETFIRRGEGL